MVPRQPIIPAGASLLGEWLWILFWLVIPNAVANLMMQDSVVALAPGFYLPGVILSTIVSVAYGIILIKISSEDSHYHTAGICTLVAGIVGFVSAVILKVEMISLIGGAVGLVGEYNELVGHSAMLVGVDDELSEKWRKLLNWYIGLYLGLLGCLLVVFLVPMLGMIAFLAVLVGLVVVSIKKLVYLYRTAKVFRGYIV